MTYRAQIEALLAAGAYPGDAEAAAQVGCTEITAEDYRQRWQRANGVQHENESGIMPPDAVDLITEARTEGLSWREVAREVNEVYGLNVNAEQCGGVYRRHGYKKLTLGPNIDYLGAYDWSATTLVPMYTFPLETSVGVMWDERITPPKYPRSKVNRYKTTCDFCEYREYCLSHPNDICRCETAQENEVTCAAF